MWKLGSEEAHNVLITAVAQFKIPTDAINMNFHKIVVIKVEGHTLYSMG